MCGLGHTAATDLWWMFLHQVGWASLTSYLLQHIATDAPAQDRAPKPWQLVLTAG